MKPILLTIPWPLWATAGAFTLITGGYFAVRTLPRLPGFLASNDILLTKVPENHWAPVEMGGKYQRGLLVKKGYHLDPEGFIAKNDPAKTNLAEKLGYKWLGWTAPLLTHRPKLDIIATRLIDPDTRGNKRVSEWITQETKHIRELKVTFPMYVMVRDIETTDGSKVTVLVRADIRIRKPYLTWYGFGGHALDTINTEIQKIVRVAFERHGIVELVQGNGEDKAEVEITGDKKVSRKPGAKTVKQDRNERLVEETGAEMTHISIEDWDVDLSPTIKAALEKEQEELARRKAELAKLVTDREIAEGEVAVWNARTEASRARTGANTQLAAAFKQLGLDKDMYGDLMLNELLTPGDAAMTLYTRAIRKTKIQWLNTGSNDAVLAGLFQRGMPRQQPASGTNNQPPPNPPNP